jgi:hypothetical protein
MSGWGLYWGSSWGLTPPGVDVSPIHQADYNRGGWLMMIEGCPIGFTSIPALAGTGATSWIGTAYGDREILLGLTVPDLPLGESQPFEARIKEERPTFDLLDFDGRVRELFAEMWPDETTDSMGTRLSPLDDPAPEFIAGPAETPIGIWGRHIGTEAIGPAGERRHFWIEPTGKPPGLDHVAGPDWPVSLITDDPRIWTGRMVAIYRIVQDPETGSWPDWDDQHAGGSLWWIGKIKGRGSFASTDRGRVFKLPCSSVASLLRKSLNLSRSTRWAKPAIGSVTLTGDELKVAAWIGVLGGVDMPDGIATTPSTFDCQTLASGNTLAGCTTRAEIRDRLNAIIQTMISGATVDGILATTNAGWTGPTPPVDQSYWQDGSADREIEISADGSVIGIKCEADPIGFDGFYLGLAVDVRVAQLLGWDINALPWTQGVGGTCPVGGPNWGGDPEDQIMPDYHVIGIFETRLSPDDSLPWSNGGAMVSREAPYPQGTVTLDPSGGDEIKLAVGEWPVQGQFGQPWTSGAQIDGVDVDTAGWWIFRGQRLTAEAYLNGGEPEDYQQVALCEWVSNATGDAVAEDSVAYARIRVLRWYDPRRFGIPYEGMTEPWVSVAGGLEIAPLGIIGGTALASVGTPAPDWRHRVIPRTLMSSGTCEWNDTGDAVELVAGTNHPADLPANESRAGDVEAADLGLGLPNEWVDWQSWYKCAAALPGGAAGALNRVTYAISGSTQAEDLLHEMMRGAGWAWSWKRTDGIGPPQLGCWDPIKPLALADVEVTITRAIAAEPSSPSTDTNPQWRAQVDLRNDGPFDRFEFLTDRGPLESDLAYRLEFESQDVGRRYRDGKITWTVEDSGLRNPAPWLGTILAPVFEWSEAARQRFALGFGERYARSARVYRQVLDATYITRIGLGTVVHVIDGSAEAPDGTLGVNHLGRVIDATILTKSFQGIRVAVLLESRPIDAVKVWGPSACAGVGSWNSGTNTLTISEDWADVGGGHNDARGFTQPAWDTRAGGALRVTIYQSEDGVTFPADLVASADIASANEEGNTLGLTSITGTIYRDTIKRIVAAPYDEQTAAWALALYIPVTEPTGLFDGNKGSRL